MCRGRRTYCDVFALAFAYSLAAGQDHSQLTYINPRAHVEECLVSGTVSPFPSRVTHRSREEVYCFCCGIDNNTLMVMCDSSTGLVKPLLTTMIVVSSGFTRPASQSPRQNCRESGSAKNYALSGPR